MTSQRRSALKIRANGITATIIMPSTNKLKITHDVFFGRFVGSFNHT